MQMTFGDWELFKILILSLREQQLLNLDDDNKSVKFAQNQPQSSSTRERKG